MRSLKLFRRADDRPPLKDRIAALKARLGRVTRRPDGGTDTHRRVMLAGSLAAAIPLPALAVGSRDDAAVFQADARMQAAVAACEAASQAYSAAVDAAHAEIGACPADLLSSDDWEAWRLEAPHAPRAIRGTRSFRWVRASQDDENHTSKAWTAPGLRIAIAYAVPLFGRGGQTPHRVRRWRALIPTAEAFDTLCTEAETRHRVDELAKASREASKASTAAQAAFDLTPATTAAGLALVARHVGQCSPDRMPANWRNLLASAANVAGVDLTATTR